MQKRNVVLLIITLVAITAGFFLYLYFFPQAKPVVNNPDVASQNFFPFGNTPKKNTPTGPANISGTGILNPLTGNDSILNSLPIKKISSFPIAGFGIYNKEVFSNIPAVVNTTPPQTLPLSGEGVNATTTNTTTQPPDKGAKGVVLKTTKPIKPTPPPTELITMVRYINKENGNIYQTPADTITETKYTNTIIPKIYEGLFVNNTKTVVMRYLNIDNKTIESYLGILPVEVLGGDGTGTNEIKGSFLPQNIIDMSISPDNSNIFYLFKNASNNDSSIIGATAGAQGDKKTQIFSSAFTGWLSQWPNAKMITLTTKPAADYPGYMYSIDPNKKDFNKILGGINGLTTLTSPSGADVLYNNSTNGGLDLNIYHINSGNSDKLSIKTLPEKCVWTKANDAIYCAVPRFLDNAKYPDAWYKGLISFGDEIWKIDVTNLNAKKISDPLQVVGEEVDGIKLTLDDNEKHLFFMNKKDNYLWELKTI